jgi:hypothetical protein
MSCTSSSANGQHLTAHFLATLVVGWSPPAMAETSDDAAAAPVVGEASVTGHRLTSRTAPADREVRVQRLDLGALEGRVSVLDHENRST